MVNYRIKLEKYNGFLSKFVLELENNLYYEQKWVWCKKCEKRHRINSNIACDHRVKPIPLKCNNIDDHCWKYTSKKKYGYIDVVIGRKDNQYIDLFLEVCAVYECFICGKEKLSEGYLIDTIDCIEDQLKKDAILFSTKEELGEILNFIRDLKKNGTELMMKYEIEFEENEKTYWINDLNKKLRKIQHLEDIIINKKV